MHIRQSQPLDDNLPALSQLRVDSGGTILLFPQSVAVLGLCENRQILFVHQFRKSVDRITIELPGGRVEAQETAAQAARRELTEESGFRASSIKRIIMLDLDFSLSRHQTTLFLANLPKLPSERGAFQHSFKPFDKALRMVEAGKISHAPTVAAIMWLHLHKEKGK